jgi:hypothetical protein
VIENLLHPFLKPERRFLCLNLLLKSLLPHPRCGSDTFRWAMIQTGATFNAIAVRIQSAKDNLCLGGQSALRNTRQYLAPNAAEE